MRKISAVTILVAGLLLLAFADSLYVRMVDLGNDRLFALDPYFHMRYAEYILDGNVPEWDIYSYFPAGRPVDFPLFWSYIMVYFYYIASAVSPGITFAMSCKILPGIIGALVVFPAFLVGKEIAGNKSGIVAAFLTGLSPAILTRTSAGFADTDGLVIFFSLLSMWSLLRLFKNPVRLNYALSIFSLSLFAITWQAFWYLPLLVLAAMPAYFLYAAVFGDPKWEQGFSGLRARILGLRKGEQFSLAFRDAKKAAVSLLAVILVVAVVGTLAGMNIVEFLRGFLVVATGAKETIVNISISELQTVDIFTEEGWASVAGRIGEYPFLISLVVFPALLLWKRFRMIPGNLLIETVMLVWLFGTFYTTLQGIRFTLLLAPAVYAIDGYVFAELWGMIDNFFKGDDE